MRGKLNLTHPNIIFAVLIGICLIYMPLFYIPNLSIGAETGILKFFCATLIGYAAVEAYVISDYHKKSYLN